MKKYTDEEKDFLLIIFRWEKIIGYAMECSVPECGNVIISLNELKTWIGKKAEIFYFPKEDSEYGRDLEDAWECLCDELYSNHDLSNEGELEEVFDNKLKLRVIKKEVHTSTKR